MTTDATSIVQTVWQQHRTARERVRALRATVPHLHGAKLAEHLAAMIRKARGLRGVAAVRERIDRLAAYFDPCARASRRARAYTLRHAPYVAYSYSPHLSGCAAKYSRHYRGYRVVRAGRTADGRYSTDIRCETVRVVWDSGGVYNGGPRSQGARASAYADLLADHRNLLYAVRRGRATVTLDDIAGQPNEELRRELIEAYGGMDRYVADAGGSLVHEDETGRLVLIPTAGEENIAAVCVTCPTTGRQYALRVPQTCKTAREAVAWTFGMRADEYRPTMQS